MGAGVTTTSITVSAKSVIMAFATARHNGGTSGAFGILVSTINGNIIKQETSRTAQDQVLRHISATCYAHVMPGTYTLKHDVISGTRDNESIVAMAIPVIAQ